MIDYPFNNLHFRNNDGTLFIETIPVVRELISPLKYALTDTNSE